MNKTSETIAKAFLSGKRTGCGNTMTDGESVWLHGNRIADWEGDCVWVTFAGWPTLTTAARLNAICECAGCSYRFCRRNGEILVTRNGEPHATIGPRDIVVIVGPSHGIVKPATA